MHVLLKIIDKTLAEVVRMETKRFTTHPILQRVFTLTKQSNDQQLSTKLAVPLWHKTCQQQPSTGSDVTIINPIPQPSTYALSPQKKFDFPRAQKLLQLEINRRCGKISKTIRYDPKLSIELVRDLAQRLRRVIKSDYLRYKMIVLVSIVQAIPTQQTHQSLIIASRCLWNQDTDGAITVKSQLGYDMVAIATAFVVYTD